MKNHTVLVVEDDPDSRSLTLLALKRQHVGYEVAFARDGAEALELLLRGAASDGGPRLPGLVLMDLRLPRVNGLEVLQRLRSEKSTAHLPVVIFSSSGEPADIEESYRSGANSYVRKPVDFDRFAVVLRQVFEFWLEVNYSSS